MEFATSDMQRLDVRSRSLNWQAERLEGMSSETEVEIPSYLLRAN